VATPRRSPPTLPVRRDRIAYLDNLKVVLVAVIIAGHSVFGYSGFKGAWPYQNVQEVRLGAVSQALVVVPTLPALLFAMGLFFLISGLVTPGSVAHKGPGRFARDRLVRLGIPLAIWTVGIWTALLFAAHRAAGQHPSFWSDLLHRHPFLEPGPMWFVEVLLIYSLGYAAWRQWRLQHASPFATHARPSGDGRAALQGRTLVLLAAGISLATMLVRPAFPFLSEQVGQLKLWQWPQYLGMFGLGIVAVQRGWFDPVPARIRRRCGQAVLLSLVALGLLFAATALAGYNTNVFGRRMNWAPTLLAALEGPLAVGTCVWLLGFAQQHLDRRPGARGRALARSAFAAFVVQGPVIITLQIALRPLGVPAEVKALIVACGAVAGSFALAWVLVSRTPVGRIL
jgi:surface polysaccharide O-acyltransferase-like enzyme